MSGGRSDFWQTQPLEEATNDAVAQFRAAVAAQPTPEPYKAVAEQAQALGEWARVSSEPAPPIYTQHLPELQRRQQGIAEWLRVSSEPAPVLYTAPTPEDVAAHYEARGEQAPDTTAQMRQTAQEYGGVQAPASGAPGERLDTNDFAPAGSSVTGAPLTGEHRQEFAPPPVRSVPVRESAQPGLGPEDLPGIAGRTLERYGHSIADPLTQPMSPGARAVGLLGAAANVGFPLPMLAGGLAREAVETAGRKATVAGVPRDATDYTEPVAAAAEFATMGGLRDVAHAARATPGLVRGLSELTGGSAEVAPAVAHALSAVGARGVTAAQDAGRAAVGGARDLASVVGRANEMQPEARLGVTAGSERQPGVLTKALARYKVTDNPSEAAYLLDDGRLLNVPDRYGDVAHEPVADLYEGALFRSEGAAILRFQRDTGAVRFRYEPDTAIDLDVQGALSPAQRATVGRLLRRDGPLVVNLERRDTAGNLLGSATTEPITSLRGVDRAWDEAARPEFQPAAPRPSPAASGIISGGARGGPEVAPPFYSALERAVQTRMPNRATPDQMAAIVSPANGVKPDELKWTGFDDFLAQARAAGRPVTKQEALDFLQANQVRVQEVVKGAPGAPPTKFGQYTLPGGAPDTYRELLLTLPMPPRVSAVDVASEFGYGPSDPLPPSVRDEIARRVDAANRLRDAAYRGGHWDEPNVLAHVRFNDRVTPGPDGKPLKTLFVEEIQSDWHQAGREKGYDTGGVPPGWRVGELAGGERFAVYNPRGDFMGALRSRTEAEQHIRGLTGTVPNAPFAKTWPELAMKRVIRWAAENGYDRVAFTTGEQQAARYDLSKQISAVAYSGTNLKAFDLDGNEVIARTGVTPAELPGIIGRELSERLLAQPPRGTLRMLEGVNLQVGGEGMNAFYDRMLPEVANKLGKKFGARVGATTIETGTGAESVHYFDIPPAMRQSVMQEGQPLFLQSGGATSATDTSLPTLLRGAAGNPLVTAGDVTRGRIGAVAGGLTGAVTGPDDQTPEQRLERGAVGAVLAGTGAMAAGPLVRNVGRYGDALGATARSAADALAAQRLRAAEGVGQRAARLQADLDWKTAAWDEAQQRLERLETELANRVQPDVVERPNWAKGSSGTRAWTRRELEDVIARSDLPPSTIYESGWGDRIDPDTIARYRREIISQGPPAADMGETPTGEAAATRALRRQVGEARLAAQRIDRDVERTILQASDLEDRYAALSEQAKQAGETAASLPREDRVAQAVQAMQQARAAAARAREARRDALPTLPADVSARGTLQRAAGTPAQAAQLRPDEPGFAGNVRLGKFSPEVEPFAVQAMQSFNEMAGQRRGVISDPQAVENARRVAAQTSVTDWLKKGPGSPFTQEETIALGATVDRVGRELADLSRQVTTAKDAGQLTPELTAAAAQKALEFGGLLAVRSGNAAEAGRTLRAFQQQVSGLASSQGLARDPLIAKAFKTLGTDAAGFADWVQRYAALDPDNTVGKYRMLQALYKPGWMDKLIAVSQNAALANPPTLATIALHSVTQTAQRPFYELIRGQPSDALTDAGYMARAMGQAFSDARQALLTGIGPSGAAASVESGSIRLDVFPGTQGLVYTGGLRLIGAMHEFTRTVNANGALALAAAREARATGRPFAEVFANPSPQMLDFAQKAAETASMGNTNPVTRALTWTRSLVHSDAPGLAGVGQKAAGLASYALLPFVRIPVWLTAMGMKALASPVTGTVRGVAHLAKGEPGEAARDFAVAAIGGAFNAVVWDQAVRGNVTGDGPKDPQQKRLLEQARGSDGQPLWQPRSMKIGGRWVDYGSSLGMLAYPVSAIASAVEAVRFEQQRHPVDPQLAQAVVNAEVKALKNAGPWRSAIDFVTGMNEDASRELGRFGQGMVSRTLPYGSSLSSVARWLDPQARAPSNLLEGYESAIPGLSQLVPPRKGVTGQPLEAPDDLASRLLPGHPTAPGTPTPHLVKAVGTYDQQRDAERKALLALRQSASYQQLTPEQRQAREQRTVDAVSQLYGDARRDYLQAAAARQRRALPPGTLVPAGR